VTGLQLLFHSPVPGSAALLLAGLCLAYLLMPLAHHLLGTDGQFYITNSNNFFADSISLQIAIWLLVAIFAWALTRLRRVLAVRRATIPARAV
jgi:hypothetical protein